MMRALIVFAVLFALALVGVPSAFAQDVAATQPEETSGTKVASAAPADEAPTDPYADGPDAEGFASLEARLSYAIGANIGTGIGQSFDQLGLTFDAERFEEGFGSAATGEELRLTRGQVEAALMELDRRFAEAQQRQQSELIARMMQEAEENALAGEQFLEQNKIKDGVLTTESGLQYTIETQGDGATPGPGDTVLIHYEGATLDGEVFESSIEQGQPVPFPVDMGVPGFREGLMLMPVGTEGTLFIPGDLAFGMNVRPDGPIGPNETVTFRVQVLEMLDDADTPEVRGNPEASEDAETAEGVAEETSEASGPTE